MFYKFYVEGEWKHDHKQPNVNRKDKFWNTIKVNGREMKRGRGHLEGGRPSEGRGAGR